MTTKKLKVTIEDEVKLSYKDDNGNHLQGKVKFIGNVENCKGVKYGIELNQSNQEMNTNNGQYNNIQYFQCEDHKSLFVEKKVIKQIINKTFKKQRRYFGNIVSIKKLECNGIIKYIGMPQNSNTIYYGILLSTPIGNSNGKFIKHGVKYFNCYPKYGIFVTKQDINSPFKEYNRYDLLFTAYIRKYFGGNIHRFPLSLIKLCIDFFIHDLCNYLLFWPVFGRRGNITAINITNKTKKKK
eukprot:32227_1